MFLITLVLNVTTIIFTKYCACHLKSAGTKKGMVIFMKRMILADSSCDIHTIPNPAPDTIFSYAPLTIRIGEREYRDDDTLNTAEMLHTMYTYKGTTSSACPSPQDWLTQFDRADEIYALTITSALSGCYNSAMTARNMALEKDPDKKILILDTLSTGPEMILLINKLNEYLSQGLDFETIRTGICEYSKRTHLLFKLETLDNLVKNGRCSKAVAKMADMLNIHIVGRASEEGTLEVLHKCRGINRSYSSIIKEMIQSGYSNGPVYISQCMNPEGAAQLKAKIEEVFENPSVTILPSGGLCSYYAERGGLLIGYESV